MNISEFKSQLNTPTVERFRRAGFKVRVTHKRPILDPEMAKLIPHLDRRAAEHVLKSHEYPLGEIRDHGYQGYIWPRGGETKVSVFKEGVGEFTATARCSIEDGYNRRSGILICLGRINRDIYEELSNRGN